MAPHTLFALAFGGLDGLLVPAGLTVIEFAVGNVVDPALQGATLQLSKLQSRHAAPGRPPGLAVGYRVTFPAAPLTTAVILLCDAFEPTRPLARFLGEAPERGSRQ